MIESAELVLVSVIVPTYNRAPLLRATLEALAAQTLPASRFEVVVSDDGSTDETPEVVAGFADRLRLRYHYQPDLGFRAAAARNAGARLAAGPLLVFLDTGVVPGATFLASHLAAQDGASGPGRVVIGYTYGYRPGNASAELARAVTSMPPDELVRRYAADERFWDVRHPAFASVRFDLGRSRLPWLQLWSLNVAVPAAAFHTVGGFDEDFRSWGGEDLELGFRLARQGLSFQVSRDAWAVDTPHDRDEDAEVRSLQGNLLRFLAKHPEPVSELLWAWFNRQEPWFQGGHRWYVEGEYRAVLRAAERAPSPHVLPELEALATGLPDGRRLAVLGCGDQVPAALASATLFDFDEGVVARVRATGADVHHAVGLRTALPDDSFDLVYVSSRLAPLWARWGPTVSAEARRIGRSVRGPGGPDRMLEAQALTR